MSLKDKT